MNSLRNVNQGVWIFLSACLVAVLSGCVASQTSQATQPSQWIIDNPYANVNWDQHLQVKANFHTHTTQSDGRMSPAEAISEYHRLGYGVLALTDHNLVTWPWQSYERNPEELEMIAVPGSELSRDHHVGAFFPDVLGTSAAAETLAEVKDQNGLAVIFHPGRYRSWTRHYVNLYREWDVLVGMEIFNQGDRYDGDRKKWDAVLSVLMPEGRPVWGFSNDDMHRPSDLGRNWNVLLLPELSPEAVRTAMQDGAFFFVHAPEGHQGAMPPSIKTIAVDSRRGIIRIEATDHARIEWISRGKIVHHGEMINVATQTDVRDYIRAVIYAKDDAALIGTQPMRIQPKDEGKESL